MKQDREIIAKRKFEALVIDFKYLRNETQTGIDFMVLCKNLEL